MPAPGLTGKAAEIWKAVYDKSVANGDDKETAAKKAWGAVRSHELFAPYVEEFKGIMKDGFLSPEPGDLGSKGRDILASTYASCRADGGDKTTCSKIAWGAVRNAGLEMPVRPEDAQDIMEPEPEVTAPPSVIDILMKLKKFLEKMGYTFDDVDPTFIENLKIKKCDTAQMGLVTTGAIEFDALPGTTYAQKILVFPRGYHYVSGYDRWFNFDDQFFAEVAKSFDDPNLSKPFIDKNHEYEMSFGDVTGYEVGEEGMFFRVILNEKGVEAVKTRTFKSISPAFGEVTDTTGKKHQIALIAISLTNNPALMGALPTLQEQIALEAKRKGNQSMEKIYMLAGALGLADQASPEAMVKAVEEIKSKLAEAMALIDALTGEKAAAEDQAAQMKAKVEAFEKKELEAEAVSVIDAAIKAGKVHPAVREFKISAFLANKEAVTKELELTPAKVTVQMTAGTVTDNIGLSDEDRAVMLSIGMNPNDPAKVEMYLKSQGVN